jgi:dienelactone hydrolase
LESSVCREPIIHTAVASLITSVLLITALVPVPAMEQELPLDYRLNERVVMVPAGVKLKARLETTVYTPNGPGPFPLLIINHGKDIGLPHDQPRDRFFVMATAFVKRGYAVMVPMRQGFAASTGRYVDHGCNMKANGYTQARDIRDTVSFAREQSWIDPERIIVAGQSYGGMATMALGADELPGVRGLINFAGGLRDSDTRCDWRNELVRAFRDYGDKNKIKSLWMYGMNDSLFDPELVSRMHDAFVDAGGQARLIQYGAFKRDSHGLVASRDGEKVWWQETERFLKQVGMPTSQIYDVPAAPALPKSDYASVDNIDAVPFLSVHGRAAYREYLNKMTPRAFAISASGAWSWSEEGEDPDSRALAACQQNSKTPCQLYSVDDYVVWPREMMVAGGGAGAPNMTASP